jgi:hypothetical protein
MGISDKEAKVLGDFYIGLKWAVFIAGIAVLVAVVVGLFAAAYESGRRNGAAEQNTEQPQAKPAARKPRARALTQEQFEALKLQDALEAEARLKAAIEEDRAREAETAVGRAGWSARSGAASEK